MATLTTSGLEPRGAAEEHDRAARRLEDAMDEQARRAEIYQQSLGTPRELDAYVRLREARGRVAAFDRWLHWVDDDDAPPPPEATPPLEEVLGH
jgi:hypothetical protein